MDLKLKRQLCQLLKDKIDAGSFDYNNGDEWYTEDFNFTKVIPSDSDIEYYVVESEYEMSSRNIYEEWDGYFGTDSSTLGDIVEFFYNRKFGSKKVKDNHTKIFRDLFEGETVLNGAMIEKEYNEYDYEGQQRYLS